MAKIYVGNLSWEAQTADLQEQFEYFGKIVDCIVMTQRDTGRSRGFGLVTFEDVQSAETAVQESDGQEFMGRPMKVKIDGGKPEGGGKGKGKGGGYGGFDDAPPQEKAADGKLFVGNLSWSTTSENLQEHFQGFGSIVDCVVMTEGDSGRSRGFGYVTFADQSSADAAIEGTDGFEFMDRPLRVNAATGKGGKGKGGKGGKGGGGFF